MTSVLQVRRVMPKGSWMVSIDLKDAYWHVPIQESFRKFLGFCIKGKKFQFRAMPFGLNVAPLIFTRLTKSILKELRLKGVQVLVYLDDWLIWAPSASECTAALEMLCLSFRRGVISSIGPSLVFSHLRSSPG